MALRPAACFAFLIIAGACLGACGAIVPGASDGGAGGDRGQAGTGGPKRGMSIGTDAGGAGTGGTTIEVVEGPGGSTGGAGASAADAGDAAQQQDAAGDAASGAARADGAVADGLADSAGERGQSLCQLAVTLDRTCRDRTECAIVSHVSSCCGQRQLLGLRASATGAFSQLEALCAAATPACDCAAGAPTVDDGSMLGAATPTAGVECVKGICTTFAPACVHPCAAGTTCRTCRRRHDDGKIDLYAVCSTPCAGAASCTDHDLRLCQAGEGGALFCTAADVVCTTD